MRRCSAAVFVSVVLVTALALSGCGGSGSSAATPTKVTFKSAAIVRNKIPAEYTCDGKNVNPPLEWGAIPSDTGELVLAEVALTPTVPASSNYNARIEWAVAGIDPALHRLAPGHLPPKAHVGLAASGKRRYDLCPKKGAIVEYQFMLYGVPTGARVAKNFADEPVLAALTKVGTRTYTTAEGAFAAVYVRK
jgi:phosphatidylethanolamine-binding protein (PEBP) family uncharacterized protein